MDFVLGLSAGNACEVREAIDTLSGRGPTDLVEITLDLSHRLTVLASREVSRDDLRAALQNGSALRAFENMCAHQGSTTFEPVSPAFISEVRATSSMTVSGFLAEPVSRASFILGSGRNIPSDDVDLSSGVTFLVKPGDTVSSGDVVALLETSRNESRMEEAATLVASSLSETTLPELGEWVSL